MFRFPIVIVLTGGLFLFCLGIALEYQKRYGGAVAPYFILTVPGLLLLVVKAAADRRNRWEPALDDWLRRHTAAVDALPARFDPIWIALAAGLGLYAELALIRYHSSCFQLFAFFKNFSLLSCFLGLGIGYALGPARLLRTPLVLPMLALQVVALHALRFTGVGELLHNPVSETLALGLNQGQDWAHAASVYGFLILTFGYNALCFLPLGQLASRLMARRPRLVAYGWNLVGSLAGIALFYALSFLWAPPAVWLGVLVLATLPFLIGPRGGAVGGAVAASAAAGVAAVAVLSANLRVDQYDVYSPYQLLTLKVGHRPHPEVKVNHVYFQNVWDLSAPTAATDEATRVPARYYALPYVFKPKPADVLIVGSGTGNDVAAAVRHGAGHIEAVEIDPTIRRLGTLLHPERPYEAPNVTSIVDDARAYIRRTDRKYDLIVYGLLDSHTLLSGMSGVRLDSYIYTVEAFREARARLKPGGVICLTFAIIRGELGRKLYLMLREAFDDREPLVYQTGYDGGVAFVTGDDLRSGGRSSWPVPEGMTDATDIVAGNDFYADKSTDDWPFFYMPARTYPFSYALMVAALLALSWVFVAQLARDRSDRGSTKNADAEADADVPGAWPGFSLPCFLLGAGFMLLETKAITELALVYGSTWVVVGVVIAAILTLAFLANLLLLHTDRIHPAAAYGLLLAALALSLGASFARSAPAGPWSGRLMMTLVVTAPLLFAGLAFSSELKRAQSVGVALGSNLLGAMLGGFLEYNSMYFGYRSLYVLALMIYGLAFASSMWASVRTRRRRDRLVGVPA